LDRPALLARQWRAVVAFRARWPVGVTVTVNVTLTADFALVRARRTVLEGFRVTLVAEVAQVSERLASVADLSLRALRTLLFTVTVAVPRRPAVHVARNWTPLEANFATVVVAGLASLSEGSGVGGGGVGVAVGVAAGVTDRLLSHKTPKAAVLTKDDRLLHYGSCR
jgi:hypothetical protein